MSERISSYNKLRASIVYIYIAGVAFAGCGNKESNIGTSSPSIPQEKTVRTDINEDDLTRLDCETASGQLAAISPGPDFITESNFKTPESAVRYYEHDYPTLAWGKLHIIEKGINAERYEIPNQAIIVAQKSGNEWTPSTNAICPGAGESK